MKWTWNFQISNRPIKFTFTFDIFDPGVTYCLNFILMIVFFCSQMICRTKYFIRLMRGPSHIRSVVIGIEYQNCGQNVGVYLLFPIPLGQIKSKLNYRLVTYKLANP